MYGLRPFCRELDVAKRIRQSNPGDAANEFVRVLLCDAGRLAGGLSDEEWRATLDYFGHCCAYTGEELKKGEAEQEHAIPINREHCGLHLYGNVVPATREANRRKRGLHFRDFVDDAMRLQKIERFLEETGYFERAKPFADLQAYCQTQYEVIGALCKANRAYLNKLLPADEALAEERLDGLVENAEEDSWRPQQGTIGAFAKKLIAEGLSDEEVLRRIRHEFSTGRTRIESIRWYRSKMRKDNPSVLTNSDLKLRSRFGTP